MSTNKTIKLNFRLINSDNIMQLQRLWQTLTFFEVIPFLSCLRQFFSGNQSTQSSTRSNMNYILLIDNNSDFAQKTITDLTNRITTNNLRIVTTNSNLATNESVEIVNSKLDEQNLTAGVLEGVETIVSFPQANIDRFIEMVNRNLNPSEMILCYFEQQNQDLSNLWGAVDDVVMGGVSDSSLRLKEKTALFTGIVSTDNNGGFASVRTKNFNPPWDLSAYQGIRLRIQGDGQRYKFITRCEGKWDGVSYCYSFDTIANVWMTIDVPFSDLIPVFRAKTVSDAGQFDSSKVYALQLMLSKFEYDGGYNPSFRAGAFCLEIESIKSYGKEDSPQLVLMGDVNTWNSYSTNTNLLKVYAEQVEDLDMI